ncbi:TOMM precursor leader peptide-binding protein [Cellulosimicrobium sp. PMB13]|uniref:TOMM precursor leader peptide-binding protein n=1 Tax=Cellulosimicrobium sp. PMB13 TaxID=3120158 RepID=UPI003F4C9D86
MSTSYEQIATTRPRIRRDVIFTKTADGVLFHNTTTGFRLTAPTGYRLATLLVPYLDGTNRVADLCDSLPEAQRAMIGELIQTLYERGFARDTPLAGPEVIDPVDAERFAAQIAYIDHYADDAPGRFARFRSTTVAVLGDDAVAIASAKGLVRNGAPRVLVTSGEVAVATKAEAVDGAVVVELDAAPGEVTWADLSGADVVLVAGGDTAARQTYSLVAAGVPEGTLLIPAWTYGERAVVGPAMRQDGRGCWVCAVLRLTSTHDAAAAAPVWSGIALPGRAPRAARPLGRPLASMVGNLLAYEAFRIVTGALPGETEGSVIVQNIESLDAIAEPLLVHPRCPFCSAAPDALDLGGWTEPTVAPEPSDEEIVAALNARQPLLQPHVGVLAGYADEELMQTPMKVGVVEIATAAGVRRSIPAFDLHHVAGARQRALSAAIVGYTARDAVTAPAGVETERVADGLLTAVRPQLVEDGPWVAATSLLTGDHVAVPLAAVEPFGAANATHGFEPTRAGGGAGDSAGEAVRAGLGTALAYAALRATIRGGAAHVVELDSLRSDVELGFLLRSARNLEVDVEVFDLSAHAPLSVVAVRTTGAGRPAWTIAADVSWRDAAVAALRDLVGTVQLAGAGQVDGGDPVMAELDAGTLVASGAVVAPLDRTTTWGLVRDALRAAGQHAFVVQVGGADLAAGGFVAVRVLLTAVGR